MSKTSKKQSNKPLHLVIEGADKVGKTTVVNMLSKMTELPVIKMQDMPKFFKTNPEEASEVFNKTVVQFKDIPFILDRFYPSSLVYSSVYDRDYDFSYLKTIKKALDPLIIVLDHESREEDDVVDAGELHLIREMYLHMSIEHGWNVIRVNEKTPVQICNEILKLL